MALFVLDVKLGPWMWMSQELPPLTRLTFEEQNIERWEMSDIETIIPRSGHLGAVPLYQR